MSIKIPIVSDFDGRGVKLAIAQFKSLEKTSERAQFAIRKAAVPATAALAGLGAAAFKAAQKASDLNEEISKSEVIFGNASKDVIAFSKTAAKEIGQSQRSALEAAGTFGVLGKAAGLTGTDLGKFSTKFTTLASDLASFNNTSPEDAIQAIGAALRGEAEPIRRYGVLLNDATLKQKALELGLIETTKGALTPQNKTLAAQAVILEQTKDAQGDFARTSEGLANQQRILKARVEDATAALGKAFLPILEQIIPILTSLADFVSENSDLVGGLTVALGLFAGAIVAARIALSVWKGIAVITTGINWALATSFTAVQVSTGIGIATALAGAGAFVIISKKMKDARDAAEGLKGSLAGVSGETGIMKNLIAASAKVTEVNTKVETAGAESAEKLAKAKAKAAAAAKKLKDAVKEAKEELIKFFNETLEDAQEKLDEAIGRFTDYAKSVSDAVLQILDFGNAQNTALGNAKDLTEALKKQNTAQGNLTKAIALDNKTLKEQRKAYEELQEALKSDDLQIRRKAQEAYNKAMEADPVENQTEALKDLEEATQAVTEAQNKPMKFIENLTDQAAKTKDFAVLVNRLIAGGLNEQSLQQVLNAGVEAGSLIAEELLSGADNILAVNTMTADLKKIADDVGINAATNFYQSGVDSGEELVNGIQAAIDKYMPLLKVPKLTIGAIASIRSDFMGDLGTLQAGTSGDFSNFDFAGIDLSGFNLDLGNIMGNVPFLSQGGLVSSPTLSVIGESGPEAVIPLDRLGEFGGGMNITVNAGLVSTPDQIGQEIIQAIQKAQRRSGPVFAPA
jgi:tetratricopeptide (TPR) repeat protein